MPPYNLSSHKRIFESEGRTLLVTMAEEQVETWTFPGKSEHMVTLIRFTFPDCMPGITFLTSRHLNPIGVRNSSPFCLMT